MNTPVRSLPVRTLVAWCPDWPVVATGIPLEEPTAVVHGNRVVAASPGARALGVGRGISRRAAQSRCADLEIHERDEAKEVRLFEPIVGGLDAITPRIEVIRPGTCALPMRGPARYFGGDEAVADRVYERMTESLAGRAEVRVGVADGPFAAGLTARAAEPIRVIPPSETAAFLAPMNITVLEGLELANVLIRLGINTLGALAALPARDVLARFGRDGQGAHRLASGLDERPPQTRLPPADWTVATEIDPPADRIDRVAFATRRLADELHRRLANDGVTCVRIGIEAQTDFGEEMLRFWRHEGSLSDAAVADRVRWQLDGWLHGSASTRPRGGISRVALVPDELISAKGRQLGFWGGETEVDERAARVAARLQGQLGTDAVLVPERWGGRHAHEQVRLVPAATVELRNRELSPSEKTVPWPGSLPAPSPSKVLASPIGVSLRDATGLEVSVTGRGMLSSAPVTLLVGSRPLDVDAWSGPWPVDERWWDADTHRRQARLQVEARDGTVWLVSLENGRWWITAGWD